VEIGENFISESIMMVYKCLPNSVLTGLNAPLSISHYPDTTSPTKPNYKMPSRKSKFNSTAKPPL